MSCLPPSTSKQTMKWHYSINVYHQHLNSDVSIQISISNMVFILSFAESQNMPHPMLEQKVIAHVII